MYCTWRSETDDFLIGHFPGGRERTLLHVLVLYPAGAELCVLLFVGSSHRRSNVYMYGWSLGLVTSVKGSRASSTYVHGRIRAPSRSVINRRRPNHLSHRRCPGSSFDCAPSTWQRARLRYHFRVRPAQVVAPAPPASALQRSSV